MIVWQYLLLDPGAIVEHDSCTGLRAGSRGEKLCRCVSHGLDSTHVPPMQPTECYRAQGRFRRKGSRY